MQTVLDSFCRCFGAPEPMPRSEGSGHDNTNNHQYRHQQEDSIVDSSTSRSDVKRRTDRLELQDKQWDELFEKASCTPRSAVVETTTASTAAMDNTHPNEQPMDTSNREDLEYAQALAKVKLAANPSRHRSSHKRKRPSKSRDEIFRHRRFEEAQATTTHYNPKPKATHASTPFSRFLSGQGVVANALCFATPIRDTDEEPATVMVKTQESNDNSDANTLNTCEDTITSTLYFESKYAHVVQSQPPMPLFNQFKVDDRHEDELRRIVASDSHNSLKMIRLMHSGTPPNRNHAHIMKLMADSSDSEGESPETSPERESTTTTSSSKTTKSRTSARRNTSHMDLDDPPPVVKAITNSSRSSSSRSNTAPLTPTSSGQPYQLSDKNSNDRRFLVL